ncbi:hypothetical protein TELCIR_12894 [Teladorsagia circumcincta]|uniref:Uncharacterized protein n=1 Tax=Teladorsagia circumcincta TaxID=45464 RepID=A0A2G9U589_TELCI|nr:hypothetical protein TELCIR_12894 [Teladorsagia circumcincta]
MESSEHTRRNIPLWGQHFAAEMASSRFELLCIVLLGLGHMCIFIGYDAQTFVVESVLHSVNAREPSRIDTHAGYYGLLFGGAVLFVVFHLNDPEAPTSNGNLTTMDESVISRQFNDTDIFWMYASFAAIASCSNMIFFFIPSRDIKQCIEGGRPQSTLPLRKEMHRMLASFIDVNMLLLMSLFVHIGLITAFWLAVYPTTFLFTKSLAVYKYLPAYYSASAGFGEIAMGVVITAGSRVIKDFGLLPTLGISSFVTVAVLAVIAASVPEWATIKPTDEPAWLIRPR